MAGWFKEKIVYYNTDGKIVESDTKNPYDDMVYAVQNFEKIRLTLKNPEAEEPDNGSPNCTSDISG